MNRFYLDVKTGPKALESVRKICRQNLSKIKLCDWPNKLGTTSWQVLKTTRPLLLSRPPKKPIFGFGRRKTAVNRSAEKYDFRAPKEQRPKDDRTCRMERF